MKKKNVLVYELLVNLVIKSICALVFLAVFVWITYKLLNSEKEWVTTVPWGIADAFVSYTTYQLSKHYFPSTITSKENKS